MKLFLKFILLVFLPVNLFANTTNVEMDALANLDYSVDAYSVSPLNFGNIFISPENKPATVILRPDGLIQSNSSDVKIVSNTSIPGEITIDGVPGQLVYIHYTDGILTNQSDVSKTIKLTDISDTNKPDRELYLKNGSENLKIGGTLNLNQNQSIGKYKGNYSVFITY